MLVPKGRFDRKPAQPRVDFLCDFSRQFFAAYTKHGMTSNNLSDEITKKGVTTVPTITKIYDYSPSFGGPIKRDKLWFYATYRKNGSNGTYPNVFFGSDPT